MAVAQIGALTDFVPGTVIQSAQVDANFDAIKTAFNNLVTGANALNVDDIAEVTANHGVEIDGVLLKDGSIVGGGAGTSITDIEDITITGDLTVGGNLDLGGSAIQINDDVVLQGDAVNRDGLGADIRYEHSAGNTNSRPAMLVYSHVDDASAVNWRNIALLAYAYSQANSGLVSPLTGIEVQVQQELAVTASTQNIYGIDVQVEAVAGSSAFTYGQRIQVLSTAGGSRRTGLLVNITEVSTATDNYGIYVSAVPAGTSGNESAGLYLEDPSTGGFGTEYTILAASGAKLTPAGIWTDGSSRANKRNERMVDLNEVRLALAGTEVKRFDRRLPDIKRPGQAPRESWLENDIGLIAEDVPGLIADPARTGVAPGRVASLAVAGWQIHETEITELQVLVADLGQRVNDLEAIVGAL